MPHLRPQAAFVQDRPRTFFDDANLPLHDSVGLRHVRRRGVRAPAQVLGSSHQFGGIVDVNTVDVLPRTSETNQRERGFLLVAICAGDHVTPARADVVDH